jgi:hypothetical protein
MVMKPGNVWIPPLSGLFGECHRPPTSSHVNRLVPASSLSWLLTKPA